MSSLSFFLLFLSLLVPWSVGASADVEVPSVSFLVLVPSQVFLRLTGGKLIRVGTYFDELMVPLLAFKQSDKINAKFTFASPQGNGITIDPSSNSSSSFPSPQSYSDAVALFDSLMSSTNYSTRLLTEFASEQPDTDTDTDTDVKTIPANEAALAEFDALFIPGGHAPLIDLWSSTAAARIVTHFALNNKPIASLCHGPIVFASTQLLNTGYLFKGYNLTIFSQGEEKFNELSWGATLSYYPDQVLINLGSSVSSGGIFQPHVVTDKNIVTGQNPQSAPALASAFLDLVVDRFSA